MKRALIAILVAIVVGCVVVGAGLAYSIQGDASLPQVAVSIDVPSGYGIGQIAEQLQAAGVVRSSALLKYYATARGIARSVDAAEYDFPAHIPMTRVVDILASGGQPPVSWVTIPEGFTAREIAHRLDSMEIVSASAFEDVTQHTSLFLGGTLTEGLEGYLYPDTYQVRRGASAQDIATLMTDQFKKKLPADYERRAHHLGYDVPQIITIASLIEREAKVDSERRLMAGVYYNRLKRGMPLEVDATIEYALPEHKTVLHQGDLTIDSPYNTYTHTGLPPTPIANPGARSIAAAFDPAHTDYLYYVYAGNGHHHFSKTLEEQNAAVRRYLH